jgi:hypothetical protein
VAFGARLTVRIPASHRQVTERITARARGRKQGCFRGGSWPASHSRVLLNPTTVGTSRYRYRAAAIPTPWPATA